MSARVARKRARTDTEDGMAGTEDGQGPGRGSEALDDSQKVLKRDADFWFDDGTVILIAWDVEFRVYSGLLTSQSSVFKDLLAQPQPVRTVTIHGIEKIPCPILHLSDSPEELRYLGS
ncbi:hypothetical protein C8Q80DRAFT_1188366 [Daedaleopsis nitida]|nr:hypothetical protein C8Q80DRAFT_1188366 [Daedaleopsis nitida]